MDEHSGRPAEEPRPAGPEEPAAPTVSVEELQAELARAREEAERNWQQFLHAAADLENYKKQAARQREDAVQGVRAQLLGVILTVVDNLERALEHGTTADPQAILEGIRMTHRQVLEVLKTMGVEPMEARGKTFDPRLHEAVDIALDQEAPPDTVVEELQRGYLWHGEVLRPARVRVAR
ncbi:MAG: nucleotide exchange factor GrpE [Armatimonadota bacterium]|nr:nucleotide exchange factor GrpE [Armatimonadota bacterium]MDR7450947.1 nucleotide exchange factor GrpE [Armatimonadota bacterium]MDR7465869.1 nucleotide exchange factor GrpE [Armatimonadota bacterium]MDR7493777.1 nucleotide exchange factor GrpE [Armatimonadota bacterium]MDR7498383.1 nucleotide exchange factor GrpE [Armatimonadota bacterium]